MVVNSDFCNGGTDKSRFLPLQTHLLEDELKDAGLEEYAMYRDNENTLTCFGYMVPILVWAYIY